MKVAITGGTGLLGTAIGKSLAEHGDQATVVSRTRGEGRIVWSLPDGFDPPDALAGYDAVVHLAGAGIADARWSDARKREILDSRRLGTRAVVEGLRAADPRPSVLVSASAVGYYGPSGDAVRDEDAPAGDDFLAEVCKVWESEAEAAEALGVRLVKARFGIMLSPDGGALAKMMPAFKLGVGGRLGSGDQYMAWIHIDDAAAAVLHLIDDPEARGAYNVSAPNPVDNRTFTKALGSALGRPTVLPVPAFGLKALFGEMSIALLTGQRAIPKRLDDSDFEFKFPYVDQALEELVGSD